MRKELDYETKQRLINIYKQVEEDFSKFPNIKTTEDIFRWRDSVKESITDTNGDYDKSLRNEIVEDAIKDNYSLKLLYDWAKCYRMIDNAKADVYMTKIAYNINDRNSYRIKATHILHRELVSQGKANSDDLFNILHAQDENLNLYLKYPLDQQRTLNTGYEFERAIVKEEDTAPWPAPLFVTLLRAYGIEGKDLLEVGRKTECLAKEYVDDIKNNYQCSEDGKSLIKSLNR